MGSSGTYRCTRRQRASGGAAARSLAALIVSVCAFASPAAAQTAQSEQSLWADISRLRSQPGASDFSVEWFTRAGAARRDLLQRIDLYLLLYPGGARVEECVRLELQTRFELATLQNDFSPFEARLASLRASPSASAAAEVAYWEMLVPGSPQPTASAPAVLSNAARLKSYQAYLQRFPASPRAPQVAALLCQAADRNGDPSMLRAALESLKRGFPDHRLTREIQGRIRLEENLGRHFRLPPGIAEGSAPRGKPLVIYCWTAIDPDAIATLRALQEQTDSGLARAVGVNMDADFSAVRRLCQENRISFHQIHDGLDGDFARDWGICAPPVFLFVDKAGNLERIATTLVAAESRQREEP